MSSVLFVCTGNICRSPFAEAVFRDRIVKRGVLAQFDSAGIYDYHIGEQPDYRAVEVALDRGIDMGNMHARQITLEDFESFDFLIAMDKGHEREMHEMCMPEHRGKIKLLLDYHVDHKGMDVPDPYYGGMVEFERSLDLIVKGIDALIDDVF